MLDANGYLAALTNPELEATSFTYTDDGLMLAKTDARQNSSTVTYDALGLLDKDQDPAGGFLDLSRSDTANGYIVSATTAEGRTSSFEVETLLDGSTKRSNTDPTGLTTVTTEGADQSVVTQTPDGTQTTVSASPDPRFGALAPLQGLTVTTPGGLVSSIDPDRTVTFDTGGGLATQTDTLSINGRVFTSVFDRAQLKFTDTSPEGRTTTSFIDAQGRIVQQQIPNIFDTGFQYDARGRLTTVTQGTSPGDRQSTIAYDANGFIASITDAVLRTTSFEYDSAGRVVKQIFPDLREVTFTYDDNGNVTSITPPGRPAHGFDYSSVNLETQYTPPSAGLSQPQTLFAYNLDRQLTQITRPDGQLISLNYDAGGRLDNVVIPRGTTSYAYDSVTGNLNSITAPDTGTLSFTYDGSLLLSSTWSGTVSGSVSRTYDNDFRITSRSVNGGSTISFTYDNDSLLTQAGSEVLTYDAQNGLLSGTTLGVTEDAYGYNGFGEVDTYNASANSIAVFTTDFVRDKIGRITQKTETVNGVQHVYDYAYDLAGRLIEVKKDSVVTATYTYDANGNRLNNGAVYDDQDRLLSTNTATYTYTDNGELLTKTEGGQTTSYSYDALGNLMAVTLPDGTSIEYVVDGRNRRIGKKINGVLTKAWLYKDGLNPIAELDGAGNVVARFVYASKANVPDFVIRGGVTYRIISDHLGSPRQVINVSDGTVAQQLDYDEWGNVLVDTNPGFQPFAFGGGLYEGDTKLVRFGARDYNAEIGRWVSKDPIRFAGKQSNFYSYALMDPVNLMDINGKYFLSMMGPQPNGFWGAADMFFDWATGTGPEHREFGPGTPQVESLKTVPAVSRALNDFYQKNKFGLGCRRRLLPLTNYAFRFNSVEEVLAAGLDPTRQYVGSFRIDIIPNAAGTVITIRLTNTTSLTSGSYKVLPSHSRSSSGIITPFGNMTQYYYWTEPVIFP